MKKIDIHVHTLYSKCSNNSLDKVIDEAKKKGLNGIAITDHNTIEGALELKKLNKDKNFEVIIGEEITTDIGHVLVYYVKRRIKPGKFQKVLRDARKQKAIVILAHPYNIVSSFFGKVFGLKNIRGSIKEKDEKFLKEFNGIEGFNSRCLLKKENLMSQTLAKKYNKIIVSGSDAHFLEEIGNSYVEFDNKLSLKEAILKNKIKFYGRKGKAFFNRIKSFFVSRIK
jgi:predicted metal-dependent phosphoesterase TrpH